MPDTVFLTTIPGLKAIDLGDGTYTMGVAQVTAPGGGTDTVFERTDPPLKAIDLGDGTYALAIVVV